MCQLLGMNANVPTDICFSFTGFRARGGLTDHHRDGWGIAFFEGKGARVFLDPAPSAHSPVAELVKHYPIRSLNVIAHIRKATQGEVRLENAHPREEMLHTLYMMQGTDLGFATPELQERLFKLFEKKNPPLALRVLQAQMQQESPPTLSSMRRFRDYLMALDAPSAETLGFLVRVLQQWQAELFNDSSKLSAEAAERLAIALALADRVAQSESG